MSRVAVFSPSPSPWTGNGTEVFREKVFLAILIVLISGHWIPLLKSSTRDGVQLRLGVVR